MKIAIIDDERPARGELRHQLQDLLPQAEFCEAENGETALAMLCGTMFDILFIDINLGDISGVALAAAARQMMPGAHIVFVTAYSEYAAQAFDLGVTDYLLKPYDEERLKKVLERCGGKQTGAGEESELQKKMVVHLGSRVVFLPISDIVYIETEKRGSVIHTQNNTYFENQTIGKYAEKLETQGFFRIHRSFLVNLDKISELFPWQAGSFAVKLKGFSEVLPVGREEAKALRRILDV